MNIMVQVPKESLTLYFYYQSFSVCIAAGYTDQNFKPSGPTRKDPILHRGTVQVALNQQQKSTNGTILIQLSRLLDYLNYQRMVIHQTMVCEHSTFPFQFWSFYLMWFSCHKPAFTAFAEMLMETGPTQTQHQFTTQPLDKMTDTIRM